MKGEAPPQHRFIADRMLGRLASYLRLMGYDVSYPPASSDAHLIATAKAERRVLLTRDHGICMRNGPRGGNPTVVEISSSEILSQLRQLVKEGWVGYLKEPRCSMCNSHLEPIAAWEARHLLPPFTCATHDNILFCSSCNAVFWEGSHWERFRKRIGPVLRFSLADGPRSPGIPTKATIAISGGCDEQIPAAHHIRRQRPFRKRV